MSRPLITDQDGTTLIGVKRGARVIDRDKFLASHEHHQRERLAQARWWRASQDTASIRRLRAQDRRRRRAEAWIIAALFLVTAYTIAALVHVALHGGHS